MGWTRRWEGVARDLVSASMLSASNLHIESAVVIDSVKELDSQIFV